MICNFIKLSFVFGILLFLMDFYIFGWFYNFFLKSKFVNVRKNIFFFNGVCMLS